MLGLKKLIQGTLSQKKNCIPSFHEMENLFVYPACFWSYCDFFIFFSDLVIFYQF